MAGRYPKESAELSPHLSEFGLIRARIFVEAELLKAYADEGLIAPLESPEVAFLDSFSTDFSLDDGVRVKDLERKADHDVVAVVNFMKERLAADGFDKLVPLVHLGPTSEDIDNIAVTITQREARDKVVIPEMDRLTGSIIKLADDTKDSPIINISHGQPAGYDTFGRNMAVFAQRLVRQREKLAQFQFDGKFNGIIGTWSGQRAAFPEESIEWWMGFSQRFVESFGLRPLMLTTQNNPHDDLVEYLQTLQRFNNILHGFESDVWDYISRRMLKQKPSGAGSSTGAAKINPWRAEHAEAMEEVASGLISTMTSNLQEYRLARDLSDKTMMRFLGEVLAVSMNAWDYARRQIELVTPNTQKMEETISEDLSPLSEALQLVLRRAGYANAYEFIRSKTQGKEFSQEQWRELIAEVIQDLNISDEQVTQQLQALTPASFIEDARAITEIVLHQLGLS